MCVTPIPGYDRRHVRSSEQGKDTMKSFNLLFTWMNYQSSWVQPGWDALWEI